MMDKKELINKCRTGEGDSKTSMVDFVDAAGLPQSGPKEFARITYLMAEYLDGLETDEEHSGMLVSEAAATYFYEQCCGMYSGHMSGVPNNPALCGFMGAHDVRSRFDFCNFLKRVFRHLDKPEEF